LWDEIYKAAIRRFRGGNPGDEILDPAMYAIQSRIMAGDFQSAARRLAEVKTQIASGQPGS